jgi:hypothetical protein
VARHPLADARASAEAHRIIGLVYAEVYGDDVI